MTSHLLIHFIQNTHVYICLHIIRISYPHSIRNYLETKKTPESFLSLQMTIKITSTFPNHTSQSKCFSKSSFPEKPQSPSEEKKTKPEPRQQYEPQVHSGDTARCKAADRHRTTCLVQAVGTYESCPELGS